MQGQIIKIVSDLHYVSCNDKVYPCKCRGIFRKEHITPLVGDYVLISEKNNIIEQVLPRRNEFKRPRVSNIDQAFIITSLVQPDFSLNLLDKLLVMMELHKVEAIICITKEDLVGDLSKYKEVLSYYEKLGYKVKVIWESEYYGDTRTLDLHIQRLRKKTGLEHKLKTVYKVGYRLEGK